MKKEENVYFYIYFYFIYTFFFSSAKDVFPILLRGSHMFLLLIWDCMNVGVQLISYQHQQSQAV